MAAAASVGRAAPASAKNAISAPSAKSQGAKSSSDHAEAFTKSVASAKASAGDRQASASAPPPPGPVEIGKELGNTIAANGRENDRRQAQTTRLGEAAEGDLKTKGLDKTPLPPTMAAAGVGAYRVGIDAVTAAKDTAAAAVAGNRMAAAGSPFAPNIGR